MDDVIKNNAILSKEQKQAAADLKMKLTALLDRIQIKTDEITFSISIIMHHIENKELILEKAPFYNPNPAWNIAKQSRFIESILLNRPLPSFYFSENEDYSRSIIDGFERIKAIDDFIKNKTALTDLKYLTSLVLLC